MEANVLALQHAMGAVFTAIAELDREVAARLPVLLMDLSRVAAVQDEMVAASIENLASLAMSAAAR